MRVTGRALTRVLSDKAGTGVASRSAAASTRVAEPRRGPEQRLRPGLVLHGNTRYTEAGRANTKNKTKEIVTPAAAFAVRGVVFGAPDTGCIP